MNKEKMAYGIAILCMIALSVVTAFAASGRKGVTTHMGHYEPRETPCLITVEHNNHTYVVAYDGGFSSTAALSMLHDPDCKCGRGGSK